MTTEQQEAILRIAPARWTFTTPAEALEAAEVLEADAQYLERCAVEYASKPNAWSQRMAERVRANAQHSATLASGIRKAFAQ